MRSRIYSSGNIRTTSKGMLWIPVVLAIGFLMAFPVAELIKLGNWFGMDYTRDQAALLYENLWKDGFLTTGYVVAAIAAGINGISQFWYLYSARKVDFYHCLPVKRSEMFWHKTFVSILYYLVPYVVMEFFTICIGAMRGFFSLHLMKLALIMLLFHLLLYLMLYFGVVLVISLTGNLLMGGICLGGLLLYGPVLSNVIATYQAGFFHTYAGESYGLTKFLFSYGSPVTLGMSAIQKYGDGKCGPAVLLILAVTVLLAIAGYFAYVKRSFENTGKALVYPWTAVIVRFLAVIPGGLGIGILFRMTPTNENSRLPWWIFGMIVGTVLAHGIMEVIIQMDFRKFLHHRLQLLLSGAIVALCALNYQFDLQGYDSYVPEYDSLAGVSSGLGMVGEYFNNVTEENGYYTIDDAAYTRAGYDLGMSQDIYHAMETFAAAAGQADYEEDEDGVYYTQCLRYRLKSGESVYRNYCMDSEQIRTLLLACYQDGNLKSIKYSSLDVDTKYLTGVTGTFCNGKTYTLFPNDRSKRTELVEALKEDIKEASPDVLTGMPCAVLDTNYERVPQKQTITSMVPGHSSMAYLHSYFYIYPEFERTIAILEETGYPLSLDEASLEKVEVKYWIGDSGEETETITYVDEKQLQELGKALVPSELCPPWVSYVSNWSDLQVTLDGEKSYENWVLKKDSYPEFMEADEKTARPELVKMTTDGSATAYDMPY